MKNTESSYKSNKMFFIVVIVLTTIIFPSNSLYQNSLTYRFTEYVMENADSAGWSCSCPVINENNLCNCHKEGVSAETFTIESPYMAILIQAELDGVSKIDLNDWNPDPIQLNMAGTNDLRPNLIDTFVSSKEPILQKIKLMPKEDLSIRYLISLSIDDSLTYKELSYREMRTAPRQGSDELVVIIPGWQSSLDPLHSMLSSGVTSSRLIVDWLDGNQFFLNEDERIYDQVVANTVYAGYHLGTYLKAAKSRRLFNNIHIIGFDIGSYVAHFAAKIINGNNYRDDSGINLDTSPTGDTPINRISRITALDPPRYLFEDDPLSIEDADYVEIHHSNAGYEDEKGMFDLIKSLRNRKFGESRQLGHASIYVNLIDPNDILSGHNHPQCVPGNGDNTPMYGCPSLMAARFFIDSMRKNTIEEFKGEKIGSEADDFFGFSLSEDKPDGSFNVQYDKDVCSTSGIRPLTIPDKISSANMRKLIFPTKSVSDRREKLSPPIEDPISLNKVGEENADCGQFNNNLNYSSRVYEGRNATDEQFPFAVCVESQVVSMWKYKFIDFAGKLLLRPDVYKPKVASLISRKERISRLKKVDLINYWSAICTGSLIDSVNGWILTAAHCFQSVPNENRMRFAIGSADCNVKDNSKLYIETEQEENQMNNKNVFIHPNTIEVWDEYFDSYVNDMSMTRFGRILKEEELKKLLPAKTDQMLRMVIKWPHEKLETFGQGVGSATTTPGCKTTNQVEDAKEEMEKKFFRLWKSDLALIKVPGSRVKESYPNSREICYKSAINFNYYNFNQYYYYAGYGNKGKSAVPNDKWLSWLTNLNKNELIKRYNNTIIMEYPFLGFSEKSDQINVANADQTNDEEKIFIASITCAGDSGGPHFIYANSGGANYNLLVGVHAAGARYMTFGDIIIRRFLVQRNANDLNYCALQLRYNVYAKKYFKNPAQFTMVSKYVDWISETTTPPAKKVIG